MNATPADPLAPLLALPGVTDAVERARSAVVAVHNHPVNRRGWPVGAAEASVRAARASAALDGARLESAETVSDPVLAGALRAAEESGRLLATWRSAPLQGLARLHVLAAAGLVPAERHDTELGRPRTDPAVAKRLALLARMLTGGTAIAAPALVAIVHGELLALRPFEIANGVVARAAARLTAVSTGLDPKALAVPEVGHLRHAGRYRELAEGFASGSPEAVGAWLVHCCEQWEAGAAEGMAIAEART